MKDPSYTLPTMQKKLVSNDPSQVDAATAFIAVDSNALGRAILLWQGCEANAAQADFSAAGTSNHPRAARFFRSPEESDRSANSKL